MQAVTEFPICSGWIGATSLLAWGCFGWDKWQAGRQGARLSESSLWLVCALGGWPGGLLGMILFRHKTDKNTFKLKFAGAFVVWAALLWAGVRFRGSDFG